ncbi:anaerobic coproporphyrinogen III oxidase [Hypnocyclicus thermotrophus]|uniref:Heme chaperone HemW n=1 Tax=Hypnocyclicus thermotrophus TaxID=1627895 RepID=A0AA46DXY4_9FUSO|nr:radical SAM family heme chaperone HemW [Hypnocyclicus thermotrophus]TDT68109.1 anaerobic coproporphyrinogen III oxidase [Hypnocyclicus thermotrophus]
MVDAIYIHIPFCQRKCYYCDFLSFSNMNDEIDNYVEHLIKEINLYPKYNFDTIYFGGGTPSLLSPKHINKILENLNFNSNSEITLEVNPITVNYDKLKQFKNSGINRLSIGIQSFDNKILKLLGRLHDDKKAISTYYDARKAGFDNISVDLMFAIPNQTLKILNNDLNILKNLNPEHISIYSLIWEEGTKFWEMKEKHILMPLSNEIEADMYKKIIDFLTKNNYIHYEISNFSKQNFEARHNSKYWENKEYIGVGLGSSGYYNRFRYKNVCFLDKYYGIINISDLPIIEKEIIDKKDSFKYILGLRLLNKGISPREDKYIKICNDLVKKEFLTNTNNKYFLTKKGIFYANDVFLEFID